MDSTKSEYSTSDFWMRSTLPNTSISTSKDLTFKFRAIRTPTKKKN